MLTCFNCEPTHDYVSLGIARYKDSDSTNFQGSAAVSLADEETVFTSMEMFCTRIRNMLDIINTLAQFGKLCEAVKDLPHMPREVPAPEEEIPEEGEGDEEPEGDVSRTISDASFEEGMRSTCLTMVHGDCGICFTVQGLFLLYNWGGTKAESFSPPPSDSFLPPPPVKFPFECKY